MTCPTSEALKACLWPIRILRQGTNLQLPELQGGAHLPSCQLKWMVHTMGWPSSMTQFPVADNKGTRALLQVIVGPTMVVLIVPGGMLGLTCPLISRQVSLCGSRVPHDRPFKGPWLWGFAWLSQDFSISTHFIPDKFACRLQLGLACGYCCWQGELPSARHQLGEFRASIGPECRFRD